MKIGLRICVNTLSGVVRGVPALLKLFDEYQVQASFFFATGPDKSGRLIGQTLQPWYRNLDFVSRLYGLALFPPLNYRRAAEVMRSVASAGHETGILCHDRAQWLGKMAHADEPWTRAELNRAIECYETVFGEKPKSIAAAGWQVNPHLLRLEQTKGFSYASDVRGKTAFFPVLQGVESNCPQLPTTLPTLNDLLRQGGDITPDNAHEYLYAESQHILPQGHVYSCDAEMEGMAYLPLMEKLVVMWKGPQGGIQPLKRLIDEANLPRLAKHQVGWAPDQTGKVYYATQSVRLEA
ncbi:MAG: polysaccharide deacetylase family protein [Candidatus Thiodiazotropha sp. (ex Dulcina madagascariensis)]|nr:polysaccharide deacetylase family protein [Candidatus Thiodiazotropha sp. (ex Dulcina madagascariensis)]MCU7927782.1 polysaccharide deacetylase family protein [Candidatus Thiodiazotropha sp. (ex Dulcina madagascariensis)]